ncbi:uncharacterized protein LOC129565937 [Sitodiplosis mosellana]|uniref:uncharacterized protein LOC129565937 n=1 Tax=Sitodiplosis mosellana TaxID=263140 RepID=UPI002445138E|nr:uncharacterized protein LOC129565937 [Sitodiplosis mosellana]
MEEKIVQIQNAFWQNVQSEVWVALDQFRQSKRKLTKKFIEHFQKLTNRRVIETCQRYLNESRPKKVKDAKNASKVNGQPKKRQNEASSSSTQPSPMKKPNVDHGDKSNKQGHDDLPCTIFFCVDCLDDKNPAKSFIGTIDDVYSHWLAKHADELLSKPFNFYAVASVGCFYCKKVGMYHELVQHHEDKHAGQQFAIVNRGDRDQCGLCRSKNDDMTNHFKVEHDMKSAPKIFNPICYTEKLIDELLKVNTHTKYQCEKCNQLFATQAEIAAHFENSHNGQAVQSKELTNHGSTPDHLICGYCQGKVDYARYSSHFWDHSYNFSCSKCKYESSNLSEMIYHEKCRHQIDTVNTHRELFVNQLKNHFLTTIIIWPNGLTLKEQNVSGTKFDGSKSFNTFLDGFFSFMVSSAKKKIELNASERSTSQSESAATTVHVITPQKQSQPQTASTVTTHSATSNRSTIIEELIEQQKLANNVFVYGIRSNLNERDLINVFLKFCREVGVAGVTISDIHQDIIQCKDGIIVKFHRMDVKKEFTSKTRGKFVHSSVFNFYLPRGHASWKIYAQNHMTDYFRKIHRAVVQLKPHSYELRKNGFAVKFGARGDEHIIQSQQELIHLNNHGKIISRN